MLQNYSWVIISSLNQLISKKVLRVFSCVKISAVTIYISARKNVFLYTFLLIGWGSKSNAFYLQLRCFYSLHSDYSNELILLLSSLRLSKVPGHFEKSGIKRAGQCSNQKCGLAKLALDISLTFVDISGPM